MPKKPSLGRRLLCLIGLHAWDGHTEPEYPAPRCIHCGAWYGPRNVTQKNIICGGDVAAGNIYHNGERKSKDKDAPQ